MKKIERRKDKWHGDYYDINDMADKVNELVEFVDGLQKVGQRIRK